MYKIISLSPEQVEEIYLSRLKKDFPPDELRPFSSMQALYKMNAYDAFGITDGSSLLGYALFVKRKTDGGEELLLDYYAVSEECRGTGIGSAFLALLQENFSAARCVILEIEDPDAAADEAERRVRERRLSFYLKNGCALTKVKANTFGVDFLILEMQPKKKHEDADIADTYLELYKMIAPPAIFEKNVKITKK